MKTAGRFTILSLLTLVVAVGVAYLATLMEPLRMRIGFFVISACIAGIGGSTFALRTAAAPRRLVKGMGGCVAGIGGGIATIGAAGFQGSTTGTVITILGACIAGIGGMVVTLGKPPVPASAGVAGAPQA